MLTVYFITSFVEMETNNLVQKLCSVVSWFRRVLRVVHFYPVVAHCDAQRAGPHDHTSAATQVFSDEWQQKLSHRAYISQHFLLFPLPIVGCGFYRQLSQFFFSDHAVKVYCCTVFFFVFQLLTHKGISTEMV